MKPAYTLEVNHKPIYIFDNVFSSAQKKKLAQDLLRTPAFRKEMSGVGAKTYQIKSPLRHRTGVDSSIMKSQVDYAQVYSVLDRLIDAVASQECDAKLERTRAYCQRLRFGEQAHRVRLTQGGGEFMAMIMINEGWKREWGGELIFYNQGRDAVAAVNHVAGRIVVFEPTIEHCLSLPQRGCYDLQLIFTVHYANA